MSFQTPNKDSIKPSKVSMNILGEPDCLDFIFSTKTPKSKLRQLAQKSVTKSKLNNTNHNINQEGSQTSVEYVLDLGAPSQPIFDSALASTTTKRSFRRQSSGPPSKFLTPTHKPRKSAVVDESFELLFKNMNVSSSPRLRPDTQTDEPEPSGSSPDAKSDHKFSDTRDLRRSRRTTIVNISEDNLHESEAEVVPQAELNQSNVSNEVYESHECDGHNDIQGCSLDHGVVDRLDHIEEVSSKEQDIAIQHEADEEDAQDEMVSDDDDDHQPTAQFHVRDESEDEEEEDQIRLKGTRMSMKKNKKSIILDSDSEEVDHPISTRQQLQGLESDDDCEENSQPHPQTLHELSISHNKRQGDQPSRPLNSRYVASDSDDSIELDPKRKAQFELNRAKVLANAMTSGTLLKTHYESPPKTKTTKKQPLIIDLTDSPPSPTRPKSTASRERAKTTTSIPPKLPTQSKTTTSTPAQRRSTLTTTAKKSTIKKEIPFIKLRDDLAESLIERLNQEVFDNKLPTELDLIWSNRLNTTAGKAKWSVFKDNQTGVVLRQKVVIELGTKVVDSEIRLMNTLAHELCHVATWIIDRQKDEKHGKYFKAWARKIHKVIPQIEVTTKHTYEIDYKFKWNCSAPDCSKTYGRHSNSIKPDKQMCECGGNLIPVPRVRKRATKEVVEDEDLTEMMEKLLVKV